jgi:hypothetical protein
MRALPKKPTSFRIIIKNRPSVTVLFRLENSKNSVFKGGDASLRVEDGLGGESLSG